MIIPIQHFIVVRIFILCTIIIIVILMISIHRCGERRTMNIGPFTVRRCVYIIVIVFVRAIIITIRTRTIHCGTFLVLFRIVVGTFRRRFHIDRIDFHDIVVVIIVVAITFDIVVVVIIRLVVIIII